MISKEIGILCAEWVQLIMTINAISIYCRCSSILQSEALGYKGGQNLLYRYWGGGRLRQSDHLGSQDIFLSCPHLPPRMGSMHLGSVDRSALHPPHCKLPAGQAEQDENTPMEEVDQTVEAEHRMSDELDTVINPVCIDGDLRPLRQCGDRAGCASGVVAMPRT